jgi:hypothetical protein
MDAALILGNNKYKNHIKGIIDYSKYMLDKKISSINKEICNMKSEFLNNLSKSKYLS